MEIDYGLKLDRHCMFLDDRLKPMISPMNNYFRDPQHTLFSSGVAESELAAIVVEMSRHGKSIDDLHRYSSAYTLPKRLGVVQDGWFSDNMFSKTGTKHFAGDMITMILLTGAFLEDEVRHGLMDKHIACFMLLVQITVIVMSSGDATASMIAALRTAVDDHARLYCELYDVPKLFKVKWHHLLHLPDDLKRMGKMLSCFPMERKHKDIKVHMVNSFRSLEQTTVYSHLNATVYAITKGLTKFEQEYLLSPDGDRSAHAVLRVGMIGKGDMVLLNKDDRGNRALGEVLGFVTADDRVFAHLRQFAPCSPKVWDTSRAHETIVKGCTVIAAVPYRFSSQHRVRIIEPALV